MSTCYAPFEIATSFPDTASLMAGFGSGAIQTGFGCFDNVAGSPHYYAAPFASAAAFWALLVNRGFFTGCYPHAYYTPAAAAVLFAAGNVTYGGVSMNRIEHRMRVEGITIGCFGEGAVSHAPGDDACTILENLGIDGYTSGISDSIAPIDGGFSDTGCEDGRRYTTCCVSLWSKLVTGLAGVANAVWAALPAKSFSQTFDCPVTIHYNGSALHLAGHRFYVDGVLIGGAGGGDCRAGPPVVTMCAYPDGNTIVFDLAAGTHTFTFEYTHDALCDWGVCGTFGNATFVAFRKEGT